MLGQYQDYIGIYDDAVQEKLCDSIIQRFESLWNNRLYLNLDGLAVESDSQYGGSLNRKDQCIFFEDSALDLAKEIHVSVGKCFEEYKKKYIGFSDLKLFSHTVKVQKTVEGGGFHGWHSEHGPGHASLRVGVWCLYLTTHEGQGETEFLTQGLRLAPKKGTLVLWPSGHTHPHRGNPVYGDNVKYIATGWLELCGERKLD